MSREHAYAYEAGYRDGSINYELEHCPACKNVADLQEALAENAKLREEIEAAKHDLQVFSRGSVQLEAENAKLREMVRALLTCATEGECDVPATDENMAEHGWIRLPVDADGVPWHVGDRTESGQTIQAMGLNKHGWHFVGTVNDIDPSIHRHYHAPTVEDVLREFANEVYADADNEIRDRDFLCAKYAKRLTLAEGEDA